MSPAPRPRPLCTVLALCLTAAAAPAQQGDEPRISRPAASERLVRAFDFEPVPAEIYDIPRFWSMAHDESRAAGSTGFPTHNSATLDDSVAHGGAGSVRLDVQSGSASLRLDTGVIPVFASTEYMVSARVRTRNLRLARAAISARYLDHASRPMPGAERRSTLVVSEGEWTPVTVALPDSLTGAAFLQIDLELLQPEQFEPSALGDHQVWEQDFPISAWFDDVAVVQLPRVRLSTNSPVNVVEAPATPRIGLLVRDFTGESLRARLILQDASGREIASEERPVDGGQFTWEWIPKLPGYGWYRVTLEVMNESVRVGSKSTDLAWVPAEIKLPAAARLDRSRIWVGAERMPAEFRPLLPEMVIRADAGGVSAPIWSAESTLENMGAIVEELIPLVESLGRAEREVAFALTDLPARLADETSAEPHRPAQAFAAAENAWAPYLLPFLDKFGQRVQRWSVGADEQGPLPLDDAGMGRLEGFLARLVPGPELVRPTAATEPPDDRPFTFVRVPFEFRPEVVRDLCAEGGSNRAVLIETLPDSFSPADTAIDAARRLIAAWAGMHASEQASRAVVELPWAWPKDSGAAPSPTVEMPVVREAMRQLAGRRVVGEFRVGPAVTCYILAPLPGIERTGAMIAWASAPAESPTLEAYLGEGPILASDLFGNQRRIDPIRSNSADPLAPPAVHRIPLSDSPLYIENADVPLALFSAAFSMDPPALPSNAVGHQVHLRLTNPWPSRIEGEIAILEPGGLSDASPEKDRSWLIAPRVAPFSIAPGEEALVPIRITCSPVEEAGPKQLVAEVRLRGSQSYPPIRLRTEFELAVDTIHLDLNYRYIAGSDDLILEAYITNKGPTPATMEVFAFAPGYPRAKASVSELAPGETITRHFPFPDGARLRGDSIAVSVQDMRTRTRITRSIDPD